MVSAAKMRKSQDATTKSRTYSTLAWELIMNLSSSEQIKGELLKTHPKADKIAVLILSTNRGLVGGLNSNLFNFAQKEINNDMNKRNFFMKLISRILYRQAIHFYLCLYCMENS